MLNVKIKPPMKLQRFFIFSLCILHLECVHVCGGCVSVSVCVVFLFVNVYFLYSGDSR